MEHILYNVLWIDDEHEALSGTKARAKRNGINLVPFKSLNGGMDELERNYPYYDGVLLDAKFFEDEDDKKGTEDTYNIHRAKERLLQLRKKFEVFVLTGQAEAYEDNTFKKSFTKIYKKGSDAEIDRLFSDIKQAASMQEDTQIRQSYRRVFDVCSEKYIGELAGQDILNLFKVTDETNNNNHFTIVRKLVEDLFIAFNKFNLLPTEFVKPTVALNEGRKFLTGKNYENIIVTEKGYQHLEGTHLPKQIAFNLKCILAITQPGAHRSEVDSFVSLVRTPFLLKSVFYQLLDVLIWFKMHVDSHPKNENWEKIENDEEMTLISQLIQGKVININSLKGYAFFKPDEMSNNVYIPPHLVTNHSLVAGMVIKVEIEDYIYNETNELKTRVKRIVL